jgi:membrane protease YdiL (CAAX protease family)
MDGYNFFIDRNGHLRSGWRLAIFCVGFLICLQVAQIMVLAIAAVLGRAHIEVGGALWDVVTGHGAILISSLIVGWACGALLEERPFMALGCSPHRGWLRNFFLGSLLGAASLFLAALLTTLTRGIRFSFDPAGARLIGQTLIVSILIFLFAAAAEEVLFRGYPLQTMARANLAWVGIVLTSVPFAAAHLRNPNVVAGFTFINTALAGLWLAVAYLRTRSLWLPFGLHWAWNWAQASVLGLPVSGIGTERFAPAPLLKAINFGPDWLTGGAYGIEGGAACTIALLISTVVIWRAKLFIRADVPVSEAPPVRKGASFIKTS